MRRLLAAGAGLVLLTGGCGLPATAETADSPPLTATPAGQVIAVGSQAEGIAADPITHLVAVGVRDPDALAIVDGRTGTVLHRVPLPGHLRHLQLAAPAGPSLVPDESSGSLLTVTLPAGDVTARIPVGRYPHDATRTFTAPIR